MPKRKASHLYHSSNHLRWVKTLNSSFLGPGLFGKMYNFIFVIFNFDFYAMMNNLNRTNFSWSLIDSNSILYHFFNHRHFYIDTYFFMLIFLSFLRSKWKKQCDVYFKDSMNLEWRMKKREEFLIEFAVNLSTKQAWKIAKRISLVLSFQLTI